MGTLRKAITRFQEAKGNTEKINIIGEIVCNHLLHRVMWVDTKLNFVLAFMVIVLALLAVLVFK